MQQYFRVATLIVAAMIMSALLLTGLIMGTERLRIFEESRWIRGETAMLPPQASWMLRVLSAYLTGGGSSYALMKDDRARTVTTLCTKRPMAQASEEIANLPEAFAVISFGDGRESFAHVQAGLTPEDAAILEGLLRSLSARLGTEISVLQDLPLLFTEPGSVQFTAPGGILVEGSLPASNRSATLVDALHASYAGTLSSSRIVRRTLDSRFSSVDIRSDDAMIHRGQTLYKGWTLRETYGTSAQEGLFTATLGTRFLIGTERDLLFTAMDERRNLLLPQRHERSILTTAGEINLARLPERFGAFIQEQQKTKIGTGTVLFSSLWKDGRCTVTLRGNEKLPELLDSLP